MSYLRGTQSTFGGIICEHTELKKDSSSQDLLSVIEIGTTIKGFDITNKNGLLFRIL